MKQKQAPEAPSKEKRIKVQWEKSVIGHPEEQRRTIQGLGFRRLHQIRILPDRPEIRGMIQRVSHLVHVLES
jgi:large subunit ribosomal protein L30